MKPTSKKYAETLERLADLVNEEHVCGCDQDSCDINAAYSNGFAVWAIQLFDWSGAESREFRTLMRRLPKRFKADAERERKAFVEAVEHDECPHCNAVVWHDGNHGDTIHCDSCGETFKRGGTK